MNVDVSLTEGEAEMLRGMLLIFLNEPQSHPTRQRCRTVLHKLEVAMREEVWRILVEECGALDDVRRARARRPDLPA